MKRLSYRRLSLAAIVAVVATSIVGSSVASRADVIFDLPDVVAVIPDNSLPFSGSFEVLLTLTGTDAVTTPLVGSYNVAFTAAGPAGLTFDSVSHTTGVAPLLPDPIFGSSIAGLQVTANDNIVPAQVSAPVTSGLVRVNYTLAPNSIGNSYTLNFTPAILNQLANGTGTTTYGLTFSGGSITAVPEAAAWQLLLVVGGSTAVVVAWRKRTRVPAATT